MSFLFFRNLHEMDRRTCTSQLKSAKLVSRLLCVYDLVLLASFEAGSHKY